MSAADDALAELRSVVARQQESLRQLKDQAAAAREQVAAERDAFRRETRGQREEAAEEDRNGSNGKARQELQRRIDAGQTTMHQVMRGVDTHWSAVQVRAEVEQGVDAKVARLRAEDPRLAAEMDQRAARRP